MKKCAFTLAEVLITLGIIGVVASLTAPALVQNTGNAKVGATLQKIVSTIENANEQILNEQEASNLSKIQGIGSMGDNDYAVLLSQKIKGSAYTTDNGICPEEWNPVAKSYDNTDFPSNQPSWSRFTFSNYSLYLYPYAEDDYLYAPKGSFLGTFGQMYVDINGNSAKPNVLGKDIFYFLIDNNGTLIPVGGKTHSWLFNDVSKLWSASDGDYSCNESRVGTGVGCAGSILENNLKVIYQ